MEKGEPHDQGPQNFRCSLCSRAHFSSAKQMFFFCFLSVATLTLFSVFCPLFFVFLATRDLAFCLFATCFHFYVSISFALLFFSKGTVRFSSKLKVLDFVAVTGTKRSEQLFIYSLVLYFFLLNQQSASENQTLRHHDKFISLINRMYKLYILCPEVGAVGNSSDITTVANPSVAFNYHQKCSLTRTHPRAHTHSYPSEDHKFPSTAAISQ